MRWRVRSRRAMTHPLVSARRAASSSLFLDFASLLAAFAVAASASPSLAPAPLTEGRAQRATRLLFFRVSRSHGGEKHASQHVRTSDTEERSVREGGGSTGKHTW